MTKFLLPAAALTAGLAIALSGCSAPNGEAADGIQIVASTDVYGDIARAIAGDGATVTNIIEGPNRDPHSYEATARDQLALSKADIVIENGGGYDPFVDAMLASSGTDTIVVISASEASGLMPETEGEEEENAEEEHADEHEEHDHIEGFNEHVWYSFAAMDAVAAEIAHHLGELDEAGAANYRANYEKFSAEIDTLIDRAELIAAEHTGEGVAITEPVPLYLLQLIGLRNLTPGEFSEAIEEGSEVAPADLRTMLTLIGDGEVRLLAYNEQTAGPETEQLRAAAQKADVPVVALTETLPDGHNYLSWMADNLDAIADALA